MYGRSGHEKQNLITTPLALRRNKNIVDHNIQCHVVLKGQVHFVFIQTSTKSRATLQHHDI